MVQAAAASALKRGEVVLCMVLGRLFQAVWYDPQWVSVSCPFVARCSKSGSLRVSFRGLRFGWRGEAPLERPALVQ